MAGDRGKTINPSSRPWEGCPVSTSNISDHHYPSPPPMRVQRIGGGRLFASANNQEGPRLIRRHRPRDRSRGRRQELPRPVSRHRRKNSGMSVRRKSIFSTRLPGSWGRCGSHRRETLQAPVPPKDRKAMPSNPGSSPHAQIFGSVRSGADSTRGILPPQLSPSIPATVIPSSDTPLRHPPATSPS